jgi:hypothetical protein
VDIIFGKENCEEIKCMGCLDMRGVLVFIVIDKRGHYLHQLRLEAGDQSKFASYS